MAQQRSQPAGGERVSLQITNVIKVGGLVVVFWAPPALEGLDPSARIGLAAFMMAGAQALDTFFAAFFGGKGK